MLLKLARSLFEPRSHRLIERALELRRQGDLRAAEQLLTQIVARFPRDAVAAINLALVFLEQNRGADGAAELERALALEPENTSAHYNLATLLRISGRHDEAIRHYALAADLPNPVPQARQELMFALLELCNWHEAQRHADILRAHCAAGGIDWQRAVAPLTAVYLELGDATCRKVAAWHADDAARGIAAVLHGVDRDARGRLRLGYLSPDLRDHPVGHLLADTLALHDRNACEVFVYSYGPDDGSEFRRRIEAGVEHFVDAATWSDDAIASRIADDKVQILVDLAGHTSAGRLGIPARRPAPIQAHYLGYPGTTGAAYIDFFIGDPVATPPEMEAAFSERLARVPECFMIGGHSSDARATDRAVEGLPANAVVYACFTNGSRITSNLFRHWMEILRAVPRSVLWLSQLRASAQANLRRAAQEAGVEPTRLAFARRTPLKADHLARLALADVALDTVGWHNGHSTTHDMLWAGLPVLTAPGRTFAARVGASLVRASGLADLVTADASEYTTAAIRLGRDASACTALKQRLAESRRTAPLFNPRGRVQDLESLYRELWDRNRDRRSQIAP